MPISSRVTIRKKMCAMCLQKSTAAVTSCHGCDKDLCRKHFNEHRESLSRDLNNVFDSHDSLLQELHEKTQLASKPLDNVNARTLIKQVNDWETTTIQCVLDAARKARDEIENLFNRKQDFNLFKQKVSKLTDELKEQQEEESFVEQDIANWIKQIEQLKIDMNQPSTTQKNSPVLEIQNIHWNTIIKVLSSSTKNTTHSGMYHYSSTETYF